MKDYPNPYSFGDTVRMSNMIKKEKEEFKIQEEKADGNEKLDHSGGTSTL